MTSNLRSQNLFRAICRLKSEAEAQSFFEDLCTPAEIDAMADRWHVAQMLEQGLPYRKINELTGVSTATITRVARCLAYGTGGYRRLLTTEPQESDA